MSATPSTSGPDVLSIFIGGYYIDVELPSAPFETQVKNYIDALRTAGYVVRVTKDVRQEVNL